MSRDYAKKPNNNRSAATSRSPRAEGKTRSRPAAKARYAPKRQAGGLSLRWILSLAVVGGFIGFIAYLNSMPPTEEQQVATPAPAKSGKPAPKDKAKDQQSYQFYDMLPETEVDPPRVKEYDPGPTPTERRYRYVVQAGSFKGQDDAERQRAQIAFQGLRAGIEKVTLDSGTIWYRVNVGPFDSRSKMNSALDKLVSINIQPLVRKIPKEG